MAEVPVVGVWFAPLHCYRALRATIPIMEFLKILGGTLPAQQGRVSPSWLEPSVLDREMSNAARAPFPNAAQPTRSGAPQPTTTFLPSFRFIFVTQFSWCNRTDCEPTEPIKRNYLVRDILQNPRNFIFSRSRVFSLLYVFEYSREILNQFKLNFGQRLNRMATLIFF